MSTNIRASSRHILICVDKEIAKCCDVDEMEKSWSYLKKRLKELGLSLPLGEVHRGRACCFGVCKNGPLLVVYPEGIWYKKCTPDVIEEIIQQHIMLGVPVQEHVLCNKQWGDSKVAREEMEERNIYSLPSDFLTIN